MYNDTNNPQQAKAKRIVQKALFNGFAVSVSDGDGGWMIERSRDAAAIIDCIGEMDMDELVFHDLAGKRAGWMLLVWEFGGTADELPADYTANEAMEAIANA